jgi:uncharacterized membrane protein YkoI
MKTKLWVLSILLLSSFMLQACKDEVNAPSSDGKEQVIQKSVSMSNGSVLSADLRSDDNSKNHWEVKVDMPGDGGIVKFEFHFGTNDLRQIKGLTPSFDYEINPGMGLIAYSTARSVALNAVKGDITEWKLEKDVSDNQWQYRFQILSSGEDFEVRISAANGTIIRIKN